MDQFEPARREMIERQLRGRGVRDPAVLAAFARVPRHMFVPPDQVWAAYEDRPLPIGGGQTISQPYIVAAMLEALRLQPHHRVLEIGTGSGYAAALLCELVSRVYTIERDARLAKASESLLRSLGYSNFEMRIGDGSLGWREHAPYDGVLVSAAAPHLPDELVAQLSQAGRMIIPVGDPHSQDLVLVRRLGSEIRTDILDGCRFVPLVGRGGFEQQP